MRAAALVAGTIISAGIYLVIAASFAFSPTWIGLGILGISLVAAVGVMLTGGSRREEPTLAPWDY